MTPKKTSSVLEEQDRVDAILHEPAIESFIAKNINVEPYARGAAECLLKQHSEAPDDDLVKTLLRVLESISRGSVKVFFSYKAKDEAIAERIVTWLKQWSAGKLEIEGMFSIEPGQNFREKIMKTIPKCDWFLLLLPSPGDQGDERDWVLYEAGYYTRGQDLAGQLVCLHHAENNVANVLEDRQSVPAEKDKVKRFLTDLFHKPNWIPGMPPLNEDLPDLETKAKDIADLIQPPSMKSCCGPHMQVRFDDASAVKGWEQLAAGTVIDSNEECRRVFGLSVTKPVLGDWFKKAQGAGKDEGWVLDLARAVQAVGDGEVSPIRATIGLGQNRSVHPSICAVKRRKKDYRKVEAIDFLFHETELPPETVGMNPDLAALAITMQFAVRIRYQVLQRFLGRRKLASKDVSAFSRAMDELRREAASDPRFADPKAVQSKVIALFAGDDKAAVVEGMYKRAGQMWREDKKGDIDRAIKKSDGGKLLKLIQELAGMNQTFLTVTSKRFADLIAQPSRR